MLLLLLLLLGPLPCHAQQPPSEPMPAGPLLVPAQGPPPSPIAGPPPSTPVAGAVAHDRPADPDAVEMQVRITWGGGELQRWAGRIAVADGQIVRRRTLGRGPESPAVGAGVGDVVIAQQSVQPLDGVDLVVRGSLDAVVAVNLAAPDQPPVEQEVTLGDLIHDSRSVALDDRGNRLSISRHSADWLQLDLAPRPLIFRPGDTLAFTPRPHLTTFNAGASCRLKIELQNARGDDALWSTELDFVVDHQGSGLVDRAVEVPMPMTEGAYDLQMTATVRRLVEVPFVRAPEMRRRLQMVVVAAEAPEPSESNWRTIDQVDPAHSTWRQWVNRLPGVGYLPGFDPAKPLGNNRMTAVEYQGRQVARLGEGGWQAFPLPVSNLHQPHVVEVDYPADVEQSLGISVLQADAAGELSPPQLDSGVQTPGGLAADDREMRTHRLVFWPRQRTPLLMLTNLRDDGPAVFSRIRILAGPRYLPHEGRSSATGRVAAAYFDKPMFPENFSADGQYDSPSKQSLDDWVTFYRGTRRMADYLQFAGYNAAVVCVVRDGAALYPSELLQPTLGHDSGRLRAAGQDPWQKDVLELMFQIFDREQLKLYPSIHFSGTLPELERQRAGGAPGLDLVGAEGTVYRKGPGRPAYNPLDPRVQQAMRKVVAELAMRYGQHPSFGGVSIQLGPDTCAQLPNEFWGLDDFTVGRFQQATGVQLGGQGPARFAQRATKISEQGDDWLAWRAAEMTRLFRSLHGEVARVRSDGRLILAGAEMFEGLASRRALAPQILRPPPVAQESLRLGIDATLLRDPAAGIVLLQPVRHSPLAPLAQHGVDLSLASSGEMRSYFGQASLSGEPVGALLYQQPGALELPDFDELNPLGKGRGRTDLRPQLAPSGAAARSRFATQLAGADLQFLLDGGEMLVMGQEEHTRGWLAEFTRLPLARFRQVQPRSPGGTQPVVIREAAVVNERRTCVYAVNESPWPVTAEVELQAPAGCQAVDSQGDPLSGWAQQGGRWWWTVELGPYELRPAWFLAEQVRVIDWRAKLPVEVVPQLERRLEVVQQRAQQLRNPRSLQTLVNPDFELPGPGAAPQGWRVAARAGQAVLDGTQQASGDSSLRLSSGPEGVVQASSNLFPAPPSGKLSVWVGMRIADPRRQPRLRVMVRGADGFYSYLFVGAGQQFQLSDQWGQGFLFPFDQIPPAADQLTLEFALIGEGEVWIDNLVLFDYWFDRRERNKLINDIGTISHDLQQLRSVAATQRFLQSYWSQFLLQHVPAGPDPVVRQPVQAADTPAAQRTAKSDGQTSPRSARNPVNRIKDFVPELRLPRLKR